MHTHTYIDEILSYRPFPGIHIHALSSCTHRHALSHSRFPPPLNHTTQRQMPPSVLVLSSPMVRAIRTIEPAVQKLGLPRERWLCYGHYYEACMLSDDKGDGSRSHSWACMHGPRHSRLGSLDRPTIAHTHTPVDHTMQCICAGGRVLFEGLRAPRAVEKGAGGGAPGQIDGDFLSCCRVIRVMCVRFLHLAARQSLTNVATVLI